MMFKGNFDKTCGTVDPQFAHNIFAMDTDRLITDKKLVRNFFIAQCLAYVLHDFYFPAGKSVFPGKLFIRQTIVAIVRPVVQYVQCHPFAKEGMSFNHLLDGLQQLGL